MNSIRRQMLIYLMTGTIVLFILLFVISDIKLKQLPAHIRDQYSEIVKARSDEVSKELKGILEQIDMISKSPIIKSMDMDQIKDYLPDLLLDKKYRNYTIAYPDGQAFTTLGHEINILGQEQYKEIFINKKDHFISQPFKSSLTNDPYEIITISHGIINDDGQVVGLINGVIKIGFLNQVIEGLGLENGGYGWITNGDGVVIAYPGFDETIKESIVYFLDGRSQDMEEVATGDSISVLEYLDNDGEKILSFFSRIKESPDWIFVVSIPEINIYRDVREVQSYILTTLLLGLAAIIIFSYYYSRSLSRPILELKNTFEVAANGNLTVRANEKIPNELGLAAGSFNMMIDQIKNLTYKDVITSLYNYNGFLLELPYRIEKSIEEDKAFAIVIISIDNFKKINSIQGYEVGDKVLHNFAKGLLDFKEPNELIARFLGDEFILFLEEDTIIDLKRRIHSLWRICNGTIQVKENDFILKTSIGASVALKRKMPAEEIIKQATMAKLMAKKNGGNCYKFYNFRLDEGIRREQRIEDALYYAVRNDELRLVYQPIIELTSKKTVGVEALLRWDHPEYNKISPLLIIQLAEQNGLIGEIGEWVLREACRQNKEWQDRGYEPTTIAVNVSTIQFQQNNFVEKVKQILKEEELEARYLELEITETNAMNNVEENLIKMEKLKEIGVGISIDDFGTGYSSLAYFTRFPINTLKIDRSFINEMLNDENSRNIVTTIINLARSIKIKIVAEGVETQDQLNQLKEMGCDKIQGYFISRPVGPREIETFFTTEDI